MKFFNRGRSALLTGLAALCVLAGSQKATRAGEVKGLGGGGEIPTPFLYSNRTVELADDEMYTLVGYVRVIGGRPYLEVDFKEHPWLASAKRSADPYYPLDDAGVSWSRFRDRRVKILALSRAEMSEDRFGALHYNLALRVLSQPVCYP